MGGEWCHILSSSGLTRIIKNGTNKVMIRMLNLTKFGPRMHLYLESLCNELQPNLVINSVKA
jgi:hypothetical protein